MYVEWISEERDRCWKVNPRTKRWEEFQGGEIVRSSRYLQTLYPGDNAVILHEDGEPGLVIVIRNDSAWFKGIKFAKGEWISLGRKWAGTTTGHEEVQFVLTSGGPWIERRRNLGSDVRHKHIQTFQHAQTVDGNSSAEVLEETGSTICVLTDEKAFRIPAETLSGQWTKTKYRWIGLRNANGSKVELVKVRHTLWRVYNALRETDTEQYKHIQQIDRESRAVVMEQDHKFSLVLDKHHAYCDGEIFADGKWVSNNNTEWCGTDTETKLPIRYIREGLTWKENVNDCRKRTFSHVQTIGLDESAVLMRSAGGSLVILDNCSASSDGVHFAKGYWAIDSIDRVSVAVADTASVRYLRTAFSGTFYAASADFDSRIRRDRGNRIEVILSGSEANNQVCKPDNQKIEKQAKNAIGKLSLEDTSREKARTMVEVGDVRIDMQGAFTEEGVRYGNIQVQTGSKTIAHVNAPIAGNPIRDIRRALLHSMIHSYKTILRNKAVDS